MSKPPVIPSKVAIAKSSTFKIGVTKVNEDPEPLF